MNIYIDYLPDNDRNRSDYWSAKNLVNDEDELVAFDTKNDLIAFIDKKDLNQVKHISINSHGCQNPACFTRNGLIDDSTRYEELVELLNSTVNGEKIILNLVGICQSHLIENHLTHLDKRFIEIWVSDENTPSIDATFRIIKDGDFDYYVDEKQLQLRKIKNLKSSI
jgi:hypothetical protein